MWLLGLIMMGSAFAQTPECVKPVELGEYERALDEAQALLVAFDDYGFREKMTDASGILLPCVAGALSPELAARHHRLLALHLHAIGSEEQAAEALAAARVADPDHIWSEDVLAPTHPLFESWEALPSEGKTRTVPEPKIGAVAFDGKVGRERPRDVPTLMQQLDSSGSVVNTLYLAPREELPRYDAIPRLRTTLAIGSVGAVVLSGVLQGMAYQQRSGVISDADKGNKSADQLTAKYHRTNTLAMTSGGFMVGAGGLAIGAVLVGQR